MELENSTVKINSSLSFPAKSEMLIDIPQLNINMREFYAIENCAIKQLIAERNTALGKIQLPSVRLQYEWTLIALLRSCIENTANQDNNKLIDKMIIWLTQKERVFDLTWANMLTQSNESHAAFSSASGFIEGDESDNITEGLFDLANLIAIKQDPQQHISMMETSLQSMLKHRVYVRLWRSQIRVKTQLDKMTADIAKWEKSFACQTRKDKEKLTIIRNVFTLFFIQEIQPIAAKMNHYHYLLKPEFMKLVNDPTLPVVFKDTIAKHANDGFDEYQKAMLKHIKIWQVIFKKCD